MAVLHDIVTWVTWNALEASVLALGVACIIKLWKMSAPFRHLLWFLVILKLLTPPVVIHPVGLSGACTEGLWVLRAQLHPPREAGTPGTGSGASDVCAIKLSGGGELDPGSMDAFLEAVLPTDVPSSEGADEIGFVEPLGGPGPFVLSEERESAFPSSVEHEGGVPQGAPIGARSAGGVSRDSGSWISVSVSMWNAAAILWVAVALLYGAWQGLRAVAFQIRLRGARAVPNGLEVECSRLAAGLGLRRAPPLRIIEGTASPLVWALGRPVVLLSTESVRVGGQALCRSLVAHELAHIRRRDHWICWLELVGSCLYWWLPTFWWARREMRESADLAADGWAVWVLGSRETYAEALLQAIEFLKVRASHAPAFGQGMGQRRTIERRLTMIMRDPLRQRLSWSARLGALLVALLVLPASPARVVGQGGAVPARPGPAKAEPARPEPAETPRVAVPDETRDPPVVSVSADEPASTGAASPPSPTAPIRPPASTGVRQPEGGVPASAAPVPEALEGPAGPAERPVPPPLPPRVRSTRSPRAVVATSEEAPGKPSTGVEARLRRLEEKLDQVMRELEAIRNRGTSESSYRPRATAVTRPPGESPGGFALGPATTPGRPPTSVSPRPTTATRTTRRRPAPAPGGFGAPAPVEPEAGPPTNIEREIEQLNAEFEARMKALRDEHQESLRRLLERMSRERRTTRRAPVDEGFLEALVEEAVEAPDAPSPAPFNPEIIEDVFSINGATAKLERVSTTMEKGEVITNMTAGISAKDWARLAEPLTDVCGIMPGAKITSIQLSAADPGYKGVLELTTGGSGTASGDRLVELLNSVIEVAERCKLSDRRLSVHIKPGPDGRSTCTVAFQGGDPDGRKLDMARASFYEAFRPGAVENTQRRFINATGHEVSLRLVVSPWE